jgi:exosortase
MRKCGGELAANSRDFLLMQLSLSRYWPHALLGLATLIVVLPAFAHAIDVWSTTEEFSYGFLIAPVSAMVIWWRRAELRRSLGAGASAGLVIVAGALLLYVLGERLGIHAITGLSVSPLLFGAAVFLWGWAAGRVLAFPFAFLAFGLGVFRGLLDSVGFALQGITAFGAASMANLVGLPVVRDGLVLSADNFAFIVADTCSGMSSLVSLLALAALWVYAARGSIPGRMVVLFSVVPLTIFANSLRVTLVLVVANFFGQDAALGFFHGASSLVLFGLALGGLLGVSRVVGCRSLNLSVG